MERVDCFAYCNGKCNALNKLYCKKDVCNFFKTREENDKAPKIKIAIDSNTVYRAE